MIIKKESIIFCVSSLSGGGAEGVCINIANELANRGWNISIVVLNLLNADYIKNVNTNVEIISLNKKSTKSSFFAIRKIIKQKNVKIAVAFDYMMTVVLSLAKVSIIRNKLYLIVRNINTFSKKKNNNVTLKKQVLFQLLSLTLNKADLVINQCKEMKNDLIENYSIKKNKVTFIYNPVNIKVQKVSQEKETIKKENYFLCIGRLENQKAFEYAIRSFSEFSKHNGNYRLKIIGKGSLKDYLHNVAKHEKIDDKVDFLGFQQNVIPFYQKAEATLLTSRFEGFPNVLIESITLGTPIISFDCPSGPKEIIKNGINGYIVKDKDIGEFSEKMKKIINNRLDSQMISSSANKYYIENIILEWEKIFNNII